MTHDDPTISVRRFDVMSTFGEFKLRMDPAEAAPLFDEAEALMHRLHEQYTRFVPTSMIERFNDAGGGDVCEQTEQVLRAALQAWVDTDGRFDIALAIELAAEGYDRDLELMDTLEGEEFDPAPLLERARTAEPGTSPAGRDAPPVVFYSDGSVRVREGSRLDLGGFVKGWAADRACEILARGGSCLVNLGGDISLHLAEGDTDPWPVGLLLPDGELTLGLSHGGIATSGQEVRVWRVVDDMGERVAHHIIDPATGRSAASDIQRLTVLAASCADAEVWSKALLMAGCDGARREADARGLVVVIVGLDGSVTLTGGLAVPTAAE